MKKIFILICIVASMGFTAVYAKDNSSETSKQLSGQSASLRSKDSTNKKSDILKTNDSLRSSNNSSNTLCEKGSSKTKDTIIILGDLAKDSDSIKYARQIKNMFEKLYESKEESTDWYGVASLLLSLLIIGYLYLLRKESKKGNSNKQIKEEEKDLPPEYTKKQLKKIDEAICAIQDKIKNLETKISQIERKSQRNEQCYTNSHSNSSITNNKQVSVNTRLYASMIKNDVFPRMGISDNIQPGTIFIMTVYGDGGTFVINDAESAQQTILSNFAYTVANAVNINSKNSAPKRIITITPGKITKLPDGWKITSKAEIELI